MTKTTLFAAGLAAFAFAATPAAAQDTLRLMTGPQGGVWVPLGGALKNIWEKAIPGVTIQTLPGAGIANVRAIDEDKAEIGFGNSISTVDGINGVAPFPRKTTNVCQLATLYPQYFQIVVNADSGINSIRDFRGKGLAVQTRGNTAEAITKQILEVHGLRYEDMRASFLPSYTDAASLLKDGQAQIFTLGTTIPASSVMDLASSRDIRMLDLRDSLEGMRKLNAGYYGIDLPANTYPKQTAPVTKIGYAAHLVVSCKLPDARVHAMMKAIQDNFRDLVLVNKAMEGVGPKEMAVDIGVKFHPGAVRFYAEQGVKVGS
ncbi:MAG: TAXI family TRAP transporter solute-binding subunit [Alphaproteobacteria bacterium]|nr:TAXI family TRAP transporter solute-binding subunit [Alphaproteobacteria bacterium]MBM3626890.1 TAXI family TRAP transporter solute-binding subunit [Alphaproteobacteria bacterium]